MNSLIAFFAENRVAANMLMFLLLGGGILVMPKTDKEIFPEVAVDTINIMTAYPGASPTQVESAVCTRIEQAIDGLPGIDEIATTASDQSCNVNARLSFQADSRESLDKIKAKVDAISTFPTGVTRPIVQQISISAAAGRIVLAGAADQRTLKTLAEKVRDDLSDLGLTQVEVENTRAYQISIEVSEFALQEYGISFEEISLAIQRNSFKASGGSVGNIALETGAQAQSADDFRDIVLLATPDGGHVKLSDVATVIDGFEESNKKSYFNGHPSVSLKIALPAGQSIIDVSSKLKKYVENPRTPLPEGIEIQLTDDTAKYFKARIDMLQENAITGLVLVFITLMLFLRTNLAFWVSVGIPIAFMGGFIMLFATGQSINMISTFGLLLVLGIVVDDAIIVAENVYNHQINGMEGTAAAIKGAQEIAKPVVFAVLTTALTFVPLMFIPGADGKMFFSLPVIVLATLFFSVVECLLILPAHLSHHKHKPGKADMGNKLQQKAMAYMEYWVNRYYRPILDKVLAWRYFTLTAFISAFFLSIAIIAGGWASVNFIPEIAGDKAIANVTYPKGTEAEVTDAAIIQLEQAASRLRLKLKEQYGQDQIEFTRSVVASTGDHTGQVVMALSSTDSRVLSGEEINTLWKQEIGELPGSAELNITSTFNKAGPPISIELASKNLDELKRAAEAFGDHLHTYDAVYGVKNSLQVGNRQVQLSLKPNAYDLGLDIQTLSAQVRQSFFGSEVQSIQRDHGEVKVVLRLPEDERSSLWHLENMRIRLADDSHVPLMAVADVFYGHSPTQIERTNLRRIIKVEAFVDESMGKPQVIKQTVISEFLNKLEQDFPSVRWSFTGQQKAQKEIMDYFAVSFLAVLLVMYMLMATLFHSYSQPLLVLTAIPFGMIGALMGHLLTGFELSIWSAAGIIAVSGIVVNDNMVLIFFVNEKREAGEPLVDAIREAGVQRFRPIILTSLTTFIGLAPLMMESSFEAQFLIPMAVSIAFGVLFATLVSLLLIPALYLILDDFGRYFSFKRLVTAPSKQETELRYGDDGVVVKD